MSHIESRSGSFAQTKLILNSNIHPSTATTPSLLIIGTFLQYIIMPIVAILFIYIFDLVYIEALSTFLYGISPGGGNSNFIAFYTDSNLELSIALR